MVSSLISRLVILVFGTLYPAYASYKAVKTKNVKEHVKWMMYWIVFALFTCAETITDVLFSWFPFYYEIKIIIVIWLLSPATRGSSILYRKFVHPTLASKEQEIDDYISKAKERSYKQVLDLGSKGVNVLMQTAIKGGGGLVNQLRRSYSLSDLSGSPEDDVIVIKDETDMRIMKKKRASPSRHSSESSSSLYFSEVDVRKNVVLSQVKSTDDISSGYSSGEVFGTQAVKMREGLVRSSSLSSPRPRSMRITRSTTAPKKTSTITENEDELFECKVEEKSSSSSDGEFKDCMEDETVPRQDQKVPSLPFKDLQLTENIDFRDTSLYPQNSRLLEHMTVLETNTKQEEKRAGKYKKRAAPQPPPSQKGEGACLQVPVVTATLILKPGEMRPLGPPSENSQTPSNIFVCHSPKARRRGHSENSSSSRAKSPFSRLMPRKLQFWHHKSDTDLKGGSPEEPKRCSWHERSHRFLAIHGLAHVKMLSKSDNNLKTNVSNSLSPFAEGTTGPLVTDSE